jgi:hypothetical protein
VGRRFLNSWQLAERTPNALRMCKTNIPTLQQRLMDVSKVRYDSTCVKIKYRFDYVYMRFGAHQAQSKRTTIWTTKFTENTCSAIYEPALDMKLACLLRTNYSTEQIPKNVVKIGLCCCTLTCGWLSPGISWLLLIFLTVSSVAA